MPTDKLSWRERAAPRKRRPPFRAEARSNAMLTVANRFPLPLIILDLLQFTFGTTRARSFGRLLACG
jgi:hypothetical protein